MRYHIPLMRYHVPLLPPLSSIYWFAPNIFDKSAPVALSFICQVLYPFSVVYRSAFIYLAFESTEWAISVNFGSNVTNQEDRDRHLYILLVISLSSNRTTTGAET